MSLDLHDISLRIGERQLIERLSLQVPPGEVVTLMGPSGSGKSSLLALISGTLAPPARAEGVVRLGGVDVTDLPAERRRIGILFQDDLLFPHLTVAGNLAFALPAIRRRERAALIEAALAEADLAGAGDRDPAALSGGERARVALLRALLAEPKALLLDEPFGKLDAALRDRIRRFTFERVRRLRLPCLLVTHDPADAEAAAGKVVHLPAANGHRA
jgi:putative thiamine transport system ATP-binding protein